MPHDAKNFRFIPHSASKQAPLRYFAILGTPTPCADREKIVVWSRLEKKNCSVFSPGDVMKPFPGDCFNIRGWSFLRPDTRPESVSVRTP